MLKNLCRKIRESRLTTKIFVVNLVVMALSFTVVGWISYDRLEADIRQQFEKDATYLLQQSAAALEEKTVQIADLASTVHYSHYIERLLESDFRSDPEGILEFWDALEYIKSLSGTNELITSFSIFAANNTVPEHWDTIYHMNRLPEGFIQSLRVYNGWSGWYYGENVLLEGMRYTRQYFIGENELLYIQPLYSLSSGDFLGFIRIGVDRGKLFAPYLSAAEELQFLILSEEGKPLLDEKQLLEGMHVPAGQQLELLRSEDSIQASLPVTSMRAHMYLRLFYNTDELNLTRITLLLTLFLALAVTAGILILLVRLVTKRLSRITALMQKAAEGDYSNLAEVGVMDEAGRIARAYNHMVGSIAHLQEALVLRERARKEAEINALQAQINPHFIYNQLEIFRTQLEENGQGGMARSIASLGKMLRYSTNWSEKSYLYNELEHLENYIRLQKTSIGGRIQYYLQCEESLLRRQVPKMILQPIVENCIIHGLRTQPVLNITVAVSLENTMLRIIVFDDGVGMDREAVDAIVTSLSVPGGEVSEDEKRHRLSHIGLNNINERIRLKYGEQYGVSLDSTEGLYTRVTILLPDSEQEKGD